MKILDIEIPSSHIEVFRAVSQASENLDERIFVIGGYVRDLIMGRSCTDIDIVTDGDGIKVAKEVKQLLNIKGELVTYDRFGTALINYAELEVEFVGARKESYRSDSRKPIVSDGTLEDDQNRRDFTINALAISLEKEKFGELVDPFNGVQDIRDKKIRTPLEPEETFSDDPLRMMRAVRFATQLDFEIVDKTYQGIKSQADRLRIVSQERITTELQKMMKSKRPSVGFKLMKDTGLLEKFFPEMLELTGVEEINGIGHKDNFYHTLEVLDGVAEKSDNVWLRWAALLHDIGKPKTKKFVEGTGWTFHGHDAVGARMVKKIFKRLRLPLNHKMRFVKKLVRLHLRPIALTGNHITDSAVRRLLYDAGDDIDDLLLLCRADITSKNERKVKRYLKNYDRLSKKLQEVEEKDKLRNWEPPIGGKEIMETFDMDPGPLVGKIKGNIREAILDGDIENNYESAKEFMLDLGKELNLRRR